MEHPLVIFLLTLTCGVNHEDYKSMKSTLNLVTMLTCSMNNASNLLILHFFDSKESIFFYFLGKCPKAETLPTLKV